MITLVPSWSLLVTCREELEEGGDVVVVDGEGGDVVVVDGEGGDVVVVVDGEGGDKEKDFLGKENLNFIGYITFKTLYIKIK